MQTNTLMMEAVRTTETLLNSYQCTWRYNPEDSHLQNTEFLNVKSGCTRNYHQIFKANYLLHDAKYSLKNSHSSRKET
jgi:hypothetical protein